MANQYLAAHEGHLIQGARHFAKSDALEDLAERVENKKLDDDMQEFLEAEMSKLERRRARAEERKMKAAQEKALSETPVTKKKKNDDEDSSDSGWDNHNARHRKRPRTSRNAGSGQGR